MTSFSLREPARYAVRYRLAIVIVAVAFLGMVTVDDFLAADTLRSLLDRASIVGFLALGLTPVLIAGHIDLSIGSTMSMAVISTIYLQEVIGNVPAVLAGLAVGAFIGVINAALVVLLRISSLVATLATLLIFSSLALLLTDSRPLSSEDPLFGIAVAGDFVSIFTPRAAMFVAAAVLMFVWLRYTENGRNVYAVGSNALAASSAGINANANVFLVFVLSGLCSGAAGVLQALSTATGSSIAGSVLLIPAITAVVIGGTRLEGGKGSTLATVGGVLALGALVLVFEYNGVPTYTQAMYTGLLLILLITLDRRLSDTTTTSQAQRRVRVGPRSSQEE